MLGSPPIPIGEGRTAFYKKRDHTQILADILNECTKPKTKTSVRRQTAVSFGVLQTCIMELLALRWLVTIEDNCGQKKLETTEKGLLFLRKYSELQILSGLKTSNKLKAAVPVVKTTRVQYKRKPKL